MNYQNYLFVGIDTHKNQHTAAIINCFHQKLGTIEIPNNQSDFDQLIDEINSLNLNNKTLVFGLEDTQGLGRSLAQWLIQNNYQVKEVNPAYTKEQRSSSPNPDKSDPVDAEAIANVLYSKWNNLPNVQKDANFKALTQLNNQRANLIKQRTQVKTRLDNLIHQQYPNYKKFFSDPTGGKTALAFWEKFPHPSQLKYYGEKRLQKFLKNQARGISKDKASTILNLVNKNKPVDKAVETRISIIPMLVEQLRLLNKQLEKINAKLKVAVEQTSYKLTTMPGINYKLAAKFIAEIGDISRFDSADQLARYAGLAPARKNSGTFNRHISKKYGCRQLNSAFHILAQQQVTTNHGKPRNPVAYKYYQKKLAEGKPRKIAFTCLQRRLVDIIYAMMRDKSAYKMPKVPEYEILDKAS